MTPYYADPWLTVYAGDCRAVMAGMPEQFVHCVVTSPPYWGLRDYGTDGQIGLEPTPEAYIETMVAVFREVRRVLRDDGTVWLNLGDSYANPGNKRTGDGESRAAANLSWGRFRDNYDPAKQANLASQRRVIGDFAGLKPKDLVGIPWRVAFALQADGWYLRSDVVWSKPNPMPESVTDRPTKSHEYVFLLSKRERYYFDADAVREPHLTFDHQERYAGRYLGKHLPDAVAPANNNREWAVGSNGPNPAGRNIRSVWTIATQPYPGAHFATFPEALVEPCVKAGTSERGVCPDCGAPWVRVVEREGIDVARGNEPHLVSRGVGRSGAGLDRDIPTHYRPTITTTGWRASCRHDAEPVPATVLDPFAGSGTTGRVAQRLGRRAVLVDLSPAYLLQALKRNGHGPDEVGTSPMFDQSPLWGGEAA